MTKLIENTTEEARVKEVLIDDGFDVEKAPDGRWYWADEQDRTIVSEGEFDTEAQAWTDLSIAREHVLEEAGLSAEGLFEDPASIKTALHSIK